MPHGRSTSVSRRAALDSELPSTVHPRTWQNWKQQHIAYALMVSFLVKVFQEFGYDAS
jgi:hypothetical protein